MKWALGQLEKRQQSTKTGSFFQLNILICLDKTSWEKEKQTNQKNPTHKPLDFWISS